MTENAASKIMTFKPSAAQSIPITSKAWTNGDFFVDTEFQGVIITKTSMARTYNEIEPNDKYLVARGISTRGFDTSVAAIATALIPENEKTTTSMD